MKNERFERYIYTGVTAILVLIAAVFVVFLFLERSAVFAFLGKVRFVLAPVIYGAVLAFLMSPVYNWCYRLTVYTGKSGEPKARFKNEKLGAFFGRSVGTAVSLVFLLAVVVSLSSMIIPQLYSSIVGIINMMPEYFQNVYDWLTDFFVNNPPVEQAILNIYEQSAQYFQNWMETDLMSNLSNFQNFQNIEKILGGVSSGVMNLITLTKNLLIGLIILILGCIMDMAPIILIATPILLPIATSIGIDPIQFGIIVVLNCGIGLLTPPVGAVLFIGSAVAKRPMEKVVKATLPFYLCMFVALLLLTYIPDISLAIPKLLGGYVSPIANPLGPVFIH